MSSNEKILERPAVVNMLAPPEVQNEASHHDDVKSASPASPSTQCSQSPSIEETLEELSIDSVVEESCTEDESRCEPTSPRNLQLVSLDAVERDLTSLTEAMVDDLCNQQVCADLFDQKVYADPCEYAQQTPDVSTEVCKPCEPSPMGSREQLPIVQTSGAAIGDVKNSAPKKTKSKAAKDKSTVNQTDQSVGVFPRVPPGVNDRHSWAQTAVAARQWQAYQFQAAAYYHRMAYVQQYQMAMQAAKMQQVVQGRRQ